MKPFIVNRHGSLVAPGFGAGAVAGYAVMRIDPRIVAHEQAGDAALLSAAGRADEGSSKEDVQAAFGG